MNTLYNKNKHTRDNSITFEEKTHIYTIDGKKGFKSVTRLVHDCFPSFNPDKVIDKMMNSRNWKKSKYYGKTKEEIKNEWKQNGQLAAKTGTRMHLMIEHFYNDMEINIDEEDIIDVEIDYFENFHKKEIENNKFYKLEPYRTEWMVYDKELKMAGSIDMTFENEDGSIDIYDWKRSKEIKKTNSWESATTDCIDFMPNANFWHYSLQLNVYKKILELKYGKKVTALYLVCLHPDSTYKTYDRINVPILEKEIGDLFEFRKTQIA